MFADFLERVKTPTPIYRKVKTILKLRFSRLYSYYIFLWDLQVKYIVLLVEKSRVVFCKGGKEKCCLYDIFSVYFGVHFHCTIETSYRVYPSRIFGRLQLSLRRNVNDLPFSTKRLCGVFINVVCSAIVPANINDRCIILCRHSRLSFTYFFHPIFKRLVRTI